MWDQIDIDVILSLHFALVDNAGFKIVHIFVCGVLQEKTALKIRIDEYLKGQARTPWKNQDEVQTKSIP